MHNFEKSDLSHSIDQEKEQKEKYNHCIQTRNLWIIRQTLYHGAHKFLEAVSQIQESFFLFVVVKLLFFLD